MESRLLELRELVDQLDGLVPRDGARLRIPADADGNTTIGTQLGYLRLGVEFLRAGLGPLEPGEKNGTPYLPLSIEYLVTADSEAPFDLCEVVDDPDRLPPRVRRLGPFGQLMAALFAVVVVGLVILGAVAVVSWLTH
jgi:hypothetical protein